MTDFAQLERLFTKLRFIARTVICIMILAYFDDKMSLSQLLFQVALWLIMPAVCHFVRHCQNINSQQEKNLYCDQSN